MADVRRLTAIIYPEDDGFVSLCPELDIASQGDTVEEAKASLVEALELFFETVSEEEALSSLHADPYVTQVEVAVA